MTIEEKELDSSDLGRYAYLIDDNREQQEVILHPFPLLPMGIQVFFSSPCCVLIINADAIAANCARPLHVKPVAPSCAFPPER